MKGPEKVFPALLRANIWKKYMFHFPEIYWTCLKEECSRSCCGSAFDRKGLLTLFDSNENDTVLTGDEKNTLIHNGLPIAAFELSNFGYGWQYAISIKDDGSCALWKGGRCSIQDTKPAVCRAYPMMGIDLRHGIYMDSRCPGFEEGRRRGIKMDAKTYVSMAAPLVATLTQRLKRLKAYCASLEP